jgi:hypothetical protein
LLAIVEKVKMLNKREEKGCTGKEVVVEINVLCAKSLQVHANNGEPTKKTWGAIKKRLEITKKKNGQSIERGERSNIDFHYAPIENLCLL